MKIIKSNKIYENPLPQLRSRQSFFHFSVNCQVEDLRHHLPLEKRLKAWTAQAIFHSAIMAVKIGARPAPCSKKLNLDPTSLITLR